jgi:hypothetical protein
MYKIRKSGGRGMNPPQPKEKSGYLLTVTAWLKDEYYDSETRFSISKNGISLGSEMTHEKAMDKLKAQR